MTLPEWVEMMGPESKGTTLLDEPEMAVLIEFCEPYRTVVLRSVMWANWTWKTRMLMSLDPQKNALLNPVHTALLVIPGLLLPNIVSIPPGISAVWLPADNFELWRLEEASLQLDEVAYEAVDCAEIADEDCSPACTEICAQQESLWELCILIPDFLLLLHEFGVLDSLQGHPERAIAGCAATLGAVLHPFTNTQSEGVL